MHTGRIWTFRNSNIFETEWPPRVPCLFLGVLLEMCRKIRLCELYILPRARYMSEMQWWIAWRNPCITNFFHFIYVIIHKNNNVLQNSYKWIILAMFDCCSIFGIFYLFFVNWDLIKKERKRERFIVFSFILSVNFLNKFFGEY